MVLSSEDGNKYDVEDAVLLGLNRYSADMMTPPIIAVALLKLSSRFPSIRLTALNNEVQALQRDKEILKASRNKAEEEARYYLKHSCHCSYVFHPQLIIFSVNFSFCSTDVLPP